MAVRSQGKRRALIAGAVVVAVVLVWLALVLAVRLAHGGEALPGTEMAGVALGGASEAEIRRRLADAPGATVALIGAGERTTVRGTDAGLDVAASVERALDAGRDGPLQGLWSGVAGLVATRTVEPVYRSEQPARRVVARAARTIDRPPFAGAIAVDPETLEAAVEPPRDGRTVDVRATTRALLAALRRGDGGTVAMTIRARPAPAPEQVEAVATEAEEFLAVGGLRFAGEQVELTPSQLAPALALERVAGSGQPRVRLGVRRAELDRLVARLAEERDRAPRDATVVAPAVAEQLTEQLDVSWRPRPANVEVRPSRPGQAVEQGAAARAIAAAIRDGRHELRLPLKTVPAAVSTAEAQGIDSLIGTFTTSFACCEPRATNIRLIAEAVDGTIVAPGERFSLNGVAGERTREKGYREAPFIADGRLVPSVGGGVSQMSTTVFNAAWFAGLQLDNFMAHSFYISRYPPGREATLDYDSIDLAWTNDTDAPVLVRSTTTDTSVTVSLYGDNGGRRVRSETGARQPVAGGDFSITVTRTIRYGDGRVASKPYTTTYDTPPPPE